jgi:hypothetical protein
MGCASSNQRDSVCHTPKTAITSSKDTTSNDNKDIANKSNRNIITSDRYIYTSKKDATNKSNRNSIKSNRNSMSCHGDENDTRARRQQRPSKAIAFKANDRISLAAALEESSNLTVSTRSADCAVICIVRSDKLAFSGAGIRRHSRRKRRRHNGLDNARIIVLRKPSRRETTMEKVDERIPTKQLKELHESNSKIAQKNKTKKTKPKGATPSTTSSKSASSPAKFSSQQSPTLSTTRQPRSLRNLSPMKRTSSILQRKNSSNIGQLVIFEDVAPQVLLQMSIPSRDFRDLQ